MEPRPAEEQSDAVGRALSEARVWQPVKPRFRPLRLIVAWVIAALAVAVSAWIVPGVAISGHADAFIVAAGIALINAILPPVIAALRLPWTIAVGFIAVLLADALALQLAADALPHDIRVDSFGDALLMSIVMAAVSMVLQTVTSTNDDDEYNLRVVRRVARRQGATPRSTRARHRVPRDRRARAPGPAARDARRQCPEHGALGRARTAPADRVGDRPLVADRREPGGHPARLQRGHPRVPLGREGARQADELLVAAELRGDRAAALDRQGTAGRRRHEPREPAVRRGRRGDPHRQPNGRREEGEPWLSRVLRQRLQRHARLVLFIARWSWSGRPRSAPSGATCSRAATAAASIRCCAARCA